MKNNYYLQQTDDDISIDEIAKRDNANSDTDVPLTDLGGNENRSEVFDENSDSPEAGTPGHPGTDEDTA